VFVTPKGVVPPTFSVLVQEVQTEGKYAIDSPGFPASFSGAPEDYNLGKNFTLNLFNFLTEGL